MLFDRHDNGKGKRDGIGMILYFTYVCLLAISVVIVARILWIQISWKPDSETSRYFLPTTTKTTIEPERGAIIGCDGRILALSTPMYQLYMDCTVRKSYFLGKKEKADSLENDWRKRAEEFTEVLAAETGINPGKCYKAILEGRKTGNKYLKLTEHFDRGTLLRLEATPFMKEGRYKSGLIVAKKDSRQYPYGTLARRTIGYVKDNTNSNGNNHIGLEGKYDYVLHGQSGEVSLRQSDNGNRIQDFDIPAVKPVDGLDVRTTLDITMQGIVDRALRRQIEENKAIEMGCAVIMDVETGAIRAMVNLVRDSVTNKLEETYNMAIGLSSEPGSVFKATTLMTALEDGCIKSLDDRIPTNNGYLPGYPPDDHVRGMQDISILHGFEISSNYVFRYLAVKNYEKDPKKFIDKLYLYKLGQAFDFDLEGMQEPQLPSPESPQWSPTDLGSIGMGYSVKETPLHMLTFYNAIANKGKMMKPYLVENFEDKGVVKKKFGPSVLNASICSKATADTLLRAMKAVTSEGTATRLKGAKVKVAGKTGTSRQVLTKEEIRKYGMSTPYVTRDGSYKNLATFVGFFPADKPKYSAIICLKSFLIKGSLYGGVLPAAAMREIVDTLHTMQPLKDSLHKVAGKVPTMVVKEMEPGQADGTEILVPDVGGLGLADAMYLVESSGLSCSYSGIGHVRSQSPKAGQKVEKGQTVNLILK